jgi:hypothetical protein
MRPRLSGDAPQGGSASLAETPTGQKQCKLCKRYGNTTNNGSNRVLGSRSGEGSPRDTAQRNTSSIAWTQSSQTYSQVYSQDYDEGSASSQVRTADSVSAVTHRVMSSDELIRSLTQVPLPQLPSASQAEPPPPPEKAMSGSHNKAAVEYGLRRCRQIINKLRFQLPRALTLDDELIVQPTSISAGINNQYIGKYSVSDHSSCTSQRAKSQIHRTHHPILYAFTNNQSSCLNSFFFRFIT